MVHETLQTRAPDSATVEKAAPGEAMQGLEHEIVLFAREPIDVLGTQDPRLRHALAQQAAVVGRNRHFVALR